MALPFSLFLRNLRSECDNEHLMQAQKRLKVFQTFLLKLIRNPTKLKFFGKIVCYIMSCKIIVRYMQEYPDQLRLPGKQTCSCILIITLCITFVLFRNSWNLLRGKLLWEMNERGSYSQNF